MRCGWACFLESSIWFILLSKFLRWSLVIFIIKGFRIIVFIFINKDEDNSPKTLNDDLFWISEELRLWLE